MIFNQTRFPIIINLSGPGRVALNGQQVVSINCGWSTNLSMRWNSGLLRIIDLVILYDWDEPSANWKSSWSPICSLDMNFMWLSRWPANIIGEKLEAIGILSICPTPHAMASPEAVFKTIRDTPSRGTLSSPMTLKSALAQGWFGCLSVTFSSKHHLEDTDQLGL